MYELYSVHSWTVKCICMNCIVCMYELYSVHVWTVQFACTNCTVYMYELYSVHLSELSSMKLLNVIAEINEWKLKYICSLVHWQHSWIFKLLPLMSVHRGICEITCDLASSNSVFLPSVHFLDIPLLINLYAAKPTISLNIVN